MAVTPSFPPVYGSAREQAFTRVARMKTPAAVPFSPFIVRLQSDGDMKGSFAALAGFNRSNSECRGGIAPIVVILILIEPGHFRIGASDRRGSAPQCLVLCEFSAR
ncbi:MAG: hypothetical protein ACLR17_10325 [Enterobacteriaceae bacterium]